MAANLAEKENISDLDFQWSWRSERGLDFNNNDLNVLEGLQPQKNLKALKIKNFAGESLPTGIFVENLVEILLYECIGCETLPMLGQLSKLELLHIRNLDSVKSIGDEFYGSNYDSERTSLFPKLKTLHISQMKSLEHWNEIGSVSNGASFPHLESLSITCCWKLVNIPNLFQEGLACIRNLKRLKVHGELQGLDWSPFMHLNSSLENLELVEMGVSSLLPQVPRQLEHLTALKSLQIVGSNGVESLPDWLGNLTSLETSNLYRCRNLKSLPSKEAMSNLTRLNHLLVSGCSQLQLGEGSFEREKVSHVPDVNIEDETTNMFLSRVICCRLNFLYIASDHDLLLLAIAFVVVDGYSK
ncbi:unnamed protein product, partial [Citrullus colocynthis]